MPGTPHRLRELILDARAHADQVDLVVRLPRISGRAKEIARLTFTTKTLPYAERVALAAAIVTEVEGAFLVRDPGEAQCEARGRRKVGATAGVAPDVRRDVTEPRSKA